MVNANHYGPSQEQDGLVFYVASPSTLNGFDLTTIQNLPSHLTEKNFVKEEAIGRGVYVFGKTCGILVTILKTRGTNIKGT